MTEKSADIKLTDYGFVFGHAEVTRLADFDGCAVVRIAGSDTKWVDVYVSPAGRSVRVFSAGQELKAPEVADVA
jgi:hypothetical protein